MTMTAAQRRAADAARKRKQRAAAKADGRPTADQTYHAIAEAVSFALLCADRRVWIEGAGWQPVNVTVVIDAAVDVLQHRLGLNRAASKRAVIDVLRPRRTHSQSGNVPSIVVTPGMATYRSKAPDAAIPSAPTVPTPPLLPQDTSLVRHVTGHSK